VTALQTAPFLLNQLSSSITISKLRIFFLNIYFKHDIGGIYKEKSKNCSYKQFSYLGGRETKVKGTEIHVQIILVKTH
jgi:hypothetical protein